MSCFLNFNVNNLYFYIFIRNCCADGYKNAEFTGIYRQREVTSRNELESGRRWSVVYYATLSISRFYIASNDRVANEWWTRKILKGKVVAYFSVLYRHLAGGTEAKHENFYYNYRCPGTSCILVRSVTAALSLIGAKWAIVAHFNRLMHEVNPRSR
jgi:hypothetical protein